MKKYIHDLYDKMMINISGNSVIEDAFYRYEMPKLVVRTEKGTKQILVNLIDVASSLERNPVEILKYYSYRFNTRTSIEHDKYMVKGIFSQSEFQSVLSDYIEQFVLCKVCRNPETVYRVKKDTVKLKCKACGSKSKVDSTIRLTEWISRNY